MQCTCTIN